MELRPLKPKKSPKVKKIVYIDETSLQNKSDLQEQETIDWLTEYFDVYIVRADGFIHLLRGDYLISPIQYTPQFHGEWLSFLRKDVKDLEKPQIDWQRIKDYFMDVVERGENVDDADNDLTVLSMLRSKLRYEDENTDSIMIEEQEDSLDDEMYDFVFHFMPWFVYNLKPERKSLLDDEDYIALNCPCGIELQKLEVEDNTCRVISFDETSFADMEVPMCMIVTRNNDEELLGYFTLEKEDSLDYMLCNVDTEEHSLLGNIRWQEIPSREQFAADVIRKYVEKKR